MTSPPAISVVIPSYNPDPLLFQRLYASLLAQTRSDFEVIIVDDASTNDEAYACVDDARFRILRGEQNSGPAACRNRGCAAARSGNVFYTDTDCELATNALEYAIAGLDRDPVVMGNTITRVETRLGRAIALLGFPGGGILGFDKVWRVDATGHTNSFSSCNLAFRRATFLELGGFDETFPVPGGEDTVLARHAVSSGCPIRYLPEMRVYHVEKSDWRGFVRWQITRGRGNYHIKRRVPSVGGYLRLRLWTFTNSLIAAGPMYAAPVLALILCSVYYQVKGMRQEAKRYAKKVR